MKDNIIFIAGVHGVGKTTICNKIKKEVNLNTYSSSDLIKRYNSSILSEEKQVNNVNDNQNILLKAISKFVDNNEVILLDGHFKLISKDNNIVDIPEQTFINMGLSKIIIIIDDPKVIVKRLMSRDSKEYSLRFIESFQEKEVSRGIDIARRLDVDAYIYKNGSDVNKLINFIKQKKISI